MSQLYENLDANYFQLLKARSHNLTKIEREALSLTTAHIGYVVFDTTLNTFCIWTGNAWRIMYVYAISGVSSSAGEALYAGGAINGVNFVHLLKGIKDDSTYIDITSDNYDIIVSLSSATIGRLLPTAPSRNSFLRYNTTSSNANWSNKIGEVDGMLYISGSDHERKSDIINNPAINGNYAYFGSEISFMNQLSTSSTNCLRNYLTMYGDDVRIESEQWINGLPTLSSRIIVGPAYIEINTASLKIPIGTPAVGNVWTCTNIDGTGAWQVPSSGGSLPTGTAGQYIKYDLSNNPVASYDSFNFIARNSQSGNITLDYAIYDYHNFYISGNCVFSIINQKGYHFSYLRINNSTVNALTVTLPSGGRYINFANPITIGANSTILLRFVYTVGVMYWDLISNSTSNAITVSIPSVTDGIPFATFANNLLSIKSLKTTTDGIGITPRTNTIEISLENEVPVIGNSGTYIDIDLDYGKTSIIGNINDSTTDININQMPNIECSVVLFNEGGSPTSIQNIYILGYTVFADANLLPLNIDSNCARILHIIPQTNGNIAYVTFSENLSQI